jgi:anti-anti-sigma factor
MDTNDATNDAQRVALQGDVRAANSYNFQRELVDAAAATNGDVIIDLAHVEFMDGSGVRAILALADALAVDGRHLMVLSPAHIVERALAELAPDHAAITVHRMREGG